MTLLRLVSGPSIVCVTRVVAPSSKRFRWTIQVSCTLSVSIRKPSGTELSAILSVTGSINWLWLHQRGVTFIGLRYWCSQDHPNWVLMNTFFLKPKAVVVVSAKDSRWGLKQWDWSCSNKPMDGSHTLIHINMLYQCTLNVCPLGNWCLFHGQLLLEPRGQFCHLLAQSAPHEQRGGLLGQTSSGGNHTISKKPNCSSELPEQSSHQGGK